MLLEPLLDREVAGLWEGGESSELTEAILWLQVCANTKTPRGALK